MDAGDAHVRDALDREPERLRRRGGLLRDRQVRRAGRDDRHGPPACGCGSSTSRFAVSWYRASGNVSVNAATWSAVTRDTRIGRTPASSRSRATAGSARPSSPARVLGLPRARLTPRVGVGLCSSKARMLAGGREGRRYTPAMAHDRTAGRRGLAELRRIVGEVRDPVVAFSEASIARCWRSSRARSTSGRVR